MEGSYPYDPKAEVVGQAILSVTAALGDKVRPILKQHSLGDLKPDEWYPLKDWLEVLNEVTTGDNPLDAVATGLKIFETAIFPPSIDSVSSAIHSIDVAYQMNHRNGDVGQYRTEDIEKGEIKVVAETPFPDYFTYGILYGLARHFTSDSESVTIVHDDTAPCKKKGKASCTYYVKWG